MRWGDQRQSTNIEDRRGLGGRGIALGGGGLGALVLAVIVCLLGGDPRQLLEGLPQQPAQQPPAASNSANKPDQNRQFMGAVMGSLEDAWRQILPQQSRAQISGPETCIVHRPDALGLRLWRRCDGAVLLPGRQ